MGNLDNLSDILMSQIEFLSCDDNFNNEDGTFNQVEFDRSVKKSDTLVDLSKQMVDITRTQLQAVDTACKWNIGQEEMPKSIGYAPPKLGQHT